MSGNQAETRKCSNFMGSAGCMCDPMSWQAGKGHVEEPRKRETALSLASPSSVLATPLAERQREEDELVVITHALLFDPLLLLMLPPNAGTGLPLQVATNARSTHLWHLLVFSQ